MRALIVKLGSIGDVIMALPMITALRRRDPGAEITWLCGDVSAPIVSLVDGVEVITLNEAGLVAGSALQKLRVVLTSWIRLRGRRFDLVITPYYDRRYRLLSLTTVAKQRRSFNRGKGRWWPVPGRYHGDEYVRLVTDVDGPDAERAEFPRLRSPRSERITALLGDSRDPLVALAPGGAKNLIGDSPQRRWPLESYRSLSIELLRRGYRMAITGAPSDGWVREAFRGLPILDLIGKTSLPDLLAVYSACAAVATHDSGPLHLALLAGAPTVALFGPTTPSVFVPPNERVRIIWGGENLPCRPCHDGRTYAPCANNRCLGEIPVEAVLGAVEDLVGGARAAATAAG